MTPFPPPPCRKPPPPPPPPPPRPPQALFSWQDPLATSLFAVGLLGLALGLWYCGLRVVLGALLLFDIRPPRFRDPWPPPPVNLLAHLPARSDLMT